jgi:hypothetical protein
MTFLFLKCQTPFKYPEGGYGYPGNVSNSDTSFYYYPLKDIEPKTAAFYDSYAYLFYQPFDEPNLSIKPQPKEIFRLSFNAALGKSVIITFAEDGIIVKTGSPGNMYSEDTSQLTGIEKFHLNLLNRR